MGGVDRRILQALQAQGRITYDELAARVGLSASATLRRVKRLEEARVIVGYVALLAPERVGWGLTAYINVRLTKHNDQLHAAAAEGYDRGAPVGRGPGFAVRTCGCEQFTQPLRPCALCSWGRLNTLDLSEHPSRSPA